MRKDLNTDQTRFVAILAKAARTQRDELLGNVAEKDLDGKNPGGVSTIRPPRWDLSRSAKQNHKRLLCVKRFRRFRKARVASCIR